MARAATTIARQGGWGGIVALLLIVCVVAVLSGVLLKGALPGGKSSGDRSAAKAPAGGLDAAGTAPSPGDALERARSLEDAVRRQAADLEKRIDAQDK